MSPLNGPLTLPTLQIPIDSQARTSPAAAIARRHRKMASMKGGGICEIAALMVALM